MADNENEFAVDTPEAYQAAETFAGQPGAETPAHVDDIDEAPAADEQPAVVPPVAAAVVPEKPTAPAKPFDRKTVIPGLHENPDGLSFEGVALATKEKLANQPKVRMMIPLDPGEKQGAYRSVTINGYRFDVKKNTMVDLPEAVAALLAQSYKIASEVVDNHPLNLDGAASTKRSALGM